MGSTSKVINVEILAFIEGFDIQKSKNNKEVPNPFDVPAFIITVCTPQTVNGHDCSIVVGEDTFNKDAIAKAKAVGKSKKKLKALLSEL